MPLAKTKPKNQRDIEVLERFVQVYCRAHHAPSGDDGLCDECRELVGYGKRRLERCPHDPKPKCKHCTTHCYAPKYRERVKQIMRYSGMHFVKRGRVDWLIKYFM